VWYGSQALNEGLIDAISTSDSYLQSQTEQRDLFEVHYRRKQKFAERMGFAAEVTFDRLVMRLWQRLNDSRYL
jgi:serine protease SohB